MKELDLFEELFSEYPNIALLHLKNSLTLLDESLEKIKAQNNGSLKTIHFSQNTQIKNYAREFEYVILSDILSVCLDKQQLLKVMYKALENSGNIIILEKKSNNNYYEIIDFLDSCGFTAWNNIDLFDTYYLITAKKLHNWDNGL